MTKFHVEVLVGPGREAQWMSMRPSGTTAPYVFDRDEAVRQRDIYILSSGMPERYRIKEVLA